MPFKTKGRICTNPKGNCITYQFLPEKDLWPNLQPSGPSLPEKLGTPRCCAIVISTESKHSLFPTGSQDMLNAALRLFS